MIRTGIIATVIAIVIYALFAKIIFLGVAIIAAYFLFELGWHYLKRKLG